jgi:hypothetical protein
MGARFTPGPWVREREQDSYCKSVVSRFLSDGNRILKVDIWSFSPEQDADLIMSAPDMAEVMTAALWMIEAMEGTSDENDKIVDDYRAALAKARGES